MSNRSEKILAILFEMAMTMGEGVDLDRLLTRMLQHFLAHTGFAVGLAAVRKSLAAPLVIERVIGSHQLMAKQGVTVALPEECWGSQVKLLDDLSPFADWNLAVGGLGVGMILPLKRFGCLILLGKSMPTTDLPLETMFRPILESLDNAVESCLLRDQHASLLRAEKEDALVKLEQERTQLRTLIDTIPDLVWLKAPDGTYIGCNRRFELLFGATEAQIIGKTDRDFVSPEIAAGFRAHDLAAMEADRAMTNEEWVTFASDGHQELLETTKTPMKDHVGNLVGVLGIGHDITAARKTQEALALSESSYRNLFDGVVETIYVQDEQGRFLDVNAAAVRMYGYPQGDFIGKTPEFLSAPGMNDLDALGGAIQRTLAGQDEHFEFWGKRSNGELFPKEVYLRLGNYRGKRAIFASAFDITERKREEEERNCLQRELQQAHKMEALGQLSGGIAHDFNNLLGIMLGFTELAEQQALRMGNPTLQGYLANILQAGDRAASVVAQMLAFSRNDQHELRPIRVQRLIQDEMSMLRSSFPSSIALELELDMDAPAIVVDPTQFQQALMNLCINARDAIEHQGTIRVGLSRLDQLDTECAACHKEVKGNWVALTVSDDGKGMEADIRDHIFNPFFTTKEVGKGSGLGLSVVYGIVHGVDGHLLLESEPGKGTLFKLLFPVSEIEGSPADRPAQGSSTAVDGAGAEVMVVDDEPVLAAYLADLLSQQGFVVTALTNSDQALAMLSHQPSRFSLLVTDQTMPGLSGLELIQAARVVNPSIAALLCTGYSEKVNAELAARMNIIYQPKPINTANFLAALAQLGYQASRQQSH